MRSNMASSFRWTTLLLLIGTLACLLQSAVAVKENDFKKCNQSGFCKRNRAYADTALAQGSNWKTPYEITADSVTFENGKLEAMVVKTINANGDTVRLPLTISFLMSGSARVTMDEEKRRNKDVVLRDDSPVRKERYNEADQWVLVAGLDLDKDAQLAHQDKTQVNIKFGLEGNHEAVIKFSPFEIDFRRDGNSHVKFNERGWLNMEHWRPKIENKEGEEAAEDESTWWDESFGGNTDSKPRGPESVAMDITFHGYEHVFGIPEHTGPLSLKQTRGGDGNYAEPYRMYNADVFEYILDSPMTLYGAIPFMQAHRKGSSVGVFWLNVAETWVDITKEKNQANPLSLGVGGKINTHTHWISESGLLDVFVLLGPTPSDLTKTYGELTGYTAMPQEFAIGYHQCRWNYISSDDVRNVDRNMDKHKIPYDVIWLDLEYTDDRKYFTWEPHSFPDPIDMGEHLDAHGRQLVVLLDPHIKKTDNYVASQEMLAQDLATHDKEQKPYEGWCWPGASNWIDCFNPKAIEWWKTMLKFDKFKGTMHNTWMWNDMSEPSVFNGPEVTMPKDNIHHGGWEHRDVHNLNGLTFQNATFQALLHREKGELRRPFILTRAFYAGSQKLGAMWTGDNQADWGHLAASIPMTINQGISGFPFAGADVGGFFGNPEKDLLVRWYQTGIWYPFFRAHAHLDARRREPYLLGEPYTQISTAAIRLRYTLLPAWYTAFHTASQDGSPIIRPMFWTHPSEEAGFALEDQFFVGATGLLVKPVTEQGKESVDIWIPDNEVYYDYFTYDVQKTNKGKYLTVSAPLEKVPVLLQGGHIIPRRDIPRRSSALMRFDDYTLVVAVSKDGNASGELYIDDGDTFEYEQDQYIHRKFTFSGNTLTSLDTVGRDTKSIKAGPWLKDMETVYVDKVIVVGAPKTWNQKEATVTSEGKTWTVKIQYHEAKGSRAAFAVVGRVGAKIGDDWSIKLA
ncbi:glycosyl hydrolases family 31-domain-containing protein [Fusarium flagelliforme]|uniref:alpha-glucosidase n=1 Tax=Fusarium flagelliforme TaxID=2675880 RepID=A0A395MU67_9HYPO|nr:glycosyl hydrolases family 31-domain-containing protein [Fusarium flagelliforme]KAH7192012.1 glycosyl hydrolases family 31-domain-containing protein [Fusarium flagelliforme]RFN51494.1 alpha 1,3-glucosidase [Fusarium flagelliforme]